MSMISFLSSRKSVRDFKNKKISDDTISKLNDIFNKIKSSSDHNIEFMLFNDGKSVYKALDGYAGYNGVMIEAPAYITLELKSDRPKDKILGMYNAEEIISALDEEGIGNCWITLSDTPDEVKNNAFSGKTLPSLILAIGYPKARNPFVEEKVTSRLPVDEIVYKKEFKMPLEISILENLNLDDMFYYVRFAPNTKNSQTWRFVLNDYSIELYLIRHEGKFYYEDAGIIMYYFERMFRMSGYLGRWQLEDEFIEEEDKVKIATIKL